uniref:Ring finger and WD repeat domain 3 n=1 Tax=Rousettus aegyptiacus TaxID=9407 RepID=A0A7J8CKX2_ROUAE|nr:ring finger and WD repeat domain 3 [Rousettus aegyptiacus]
MAHEAMDYDLQVQLDHHAAEQSAPADVVNSQRGPNLLQPAPQVSIDLTQEVELLGEENVENINPGASEEHRQGSGANRIIRVASLDSVSSFFSGLQRLHGMLEFLRPRTDHNVGPVRARRSRGFASRRGRVGGSQRTDNARSRTPLDAYFQVSRTQPHLPSTSHDSGASNPVSEDLEVSSNSDSDSDSSIEYEEVVVQAEEPGVVVVEAEQPGDISAEQEVICIGGRETLPKQSPQKSSILQPSAPDEEEGDTCTICLELLIFLKGPTIFLMLLGYRSLQLNTGGHCRT